MKKLMIKDQLNISGNRGLSLIEVLIAVLVLSIGLLGLAALQTFSVQASQNAYYRTQATNLAYEVADFARVNRSAVVDACAIPLLPGWTNFVSTQLPSGTLTPAIVDCSDGVIRVTVTWGENRIQDTVGGVETVEIETRI